MRLLVKRDKSRKRLMVDHPDTGILVEWRSLSKDEKKWAVRSYFKEYFDEAYNQIMFNLLDPDSNKDEEELQEIAFEIGRRFLAYVSGFDPDKTNNTTRGNFRELRDDSALKNKLT